MHAAVAAELIDAAARLETVLAQRVRTVEQAEIGGRNHRQLQAQFCTDGTVAAPGAQAQVDVGFKAHAAAVAAAGIGSLHASFSIAEAGSLPVCKKF
jgi:hypothetical protein